MRILAIEQVDQCLDGVVVSDYHLDLDIDDSFVRRLGILGALEYWAQLRRPLFRICRQGRFRLMGVVGSRRVRVTMLPGSAESDRADLCSALTSEQEQR